MEFIKELAEEEKKHGASFADAGEVLCTDDNHHGGDKHYHKAGVTTASDAGRRDDIKKIMHEADLQIKTSQIEHRIQDVLHGKFHDDNAHSHNSRASAVNDLMMSMKNGETLDM